MATHSSILVWKIPWTEELGRLHTWGHKELDKTEQLHILSFGESPQGNTITLETIIFFFFKLRSPFCSLHMNLYLPPEGDTSS